MTPVVSAKPKVNNYRSNYSEPQGHSMVALRDVYLLDAATQKKNEIDTKNTLITIADSAKSEGNRNRSRP